MNAFPIIGIVISRQFRIDISQIYPRYIHARPNGDWKVWRFIITNMFFEFQIMYIFYLLTARVTVFTDDPAMHTFGSHSQLFRDEKAKTRGVEICARTDDSILRKTAEFPGYVR